MMPKYTLTYERTTHYRHEVIADSLEQAEELFEKNESVCVDEQETWHTTDIEEME
jgi:hypothetical protein